MKAKSYRFLFLLLSVIALVLFLSSFLIQGTVIKDRRSGNLRSLFSKANTTYEIRYNHKFTSQVTIPANCTLVFNGGSLSGPVVFNSTTLSGDVRLQGSTLSGTVSNEYVDASWLCKADGKSDDAANINMLVNVSDSIVFPAGTYRLVSNHVVPRNYSQSVQSAVESHIGINRSNVSLRGLDGCVLLADSPGVSICVYSKPRDIPASIRDIRIENILFKVLNDGSSFHEFAHTIKTCGVNGLVIENCTFEDFWGDAICLSHYGDTPQTGERTRNTDVLISNNTIRGGEKHNNRNGISVISGKDVIIDSNTIIGTSADNMPGAIDIEPNNSAYTIDNIRVSNNVIENCNGGVGSICVIANSNKGPAHNVQIVNNKISKSRVGITIYVQSDDTVSDIEIVDNVVSADTVPYKFIGNGRTRNWKITGNEFPGKANHKLGGNIKFRNLEQKNNKLKR